ncbi:hypothetical protein [Candidatus Aalborgicola defluviihabitans]|uniref:hypothetical protein n=1 Tax=Candidatus Aalborgicola defluviihabitans TaxID=3386187 RepID=UPI0039B9525F
MQSIEQARTAYESGDLRERLRRYHADVDGAFWQWNDVWLSAAFRAFDIRQDCQRIGAPVLAIQGEDDPCGTMAQIDEIALPPSQIERVTLALRPLTASRPDTGGNRTSVHFAQASLKAVGLSTTSHDANVQPNWARTFRSPSFAIVMVAAYV